MSIFNPWVILAFILAMITSFSGGYLKGGQDEFAKQQMEIARLNNEARQTEQALVTAVQKQATELVKANNNAKLVTQKRNSDIDSGTLRLRIPVKAPDCSIPTPTESTSPPRDSVQATAELDREVAKSLVAITEQGDANTRQLNACIDAYNSIYQTLKGKP
jgi:hypothetical protein